MKLDINYKEKKEKKQKHMETKQHVSKQPTGEEIKREIKKFLETNDNENMTYGMQQKQF